MQEARLIKRIEISHYMIDEDTLNLVVPGDLITSEEGFMKYRLSNQAAMAPTRSAIKSEHLLWVQSKSQTNSSSWILSGANILRKWATL